MIRIRIPKEDDTQLFRIIVGRLIPFAREARPEVRFRRSEVLSRWKGCRVYVAEGPGHKIRGFVSCKVEGEILLIDMLAVTRQAEGRGVGSALIGAAERYGRRNGAASARLGVDEPNRHALQFYTRKGYGTEAYLQEHRMYVMSKRL